MTGHRGDEEEAVPGCCAEAGERCPQHRQAAAVVRHQGLRPRGEGRGGRVVGESGKAKPDRPRNGGA
jgi:hypothetical protein